MRTICFHDMFVDKKACYMSNDFMFTVAGQRFRDNIASIAQSLRVIAKAIKERNEKKQEAEDDEHR